MGLSRGAQGVTGMGLEKCQDEHWDGTGPASGWGVRGAIHELSRKGPGEQQNGMGWDGGAAGQAGGAPGWERETGAGLSAWNREGVGWDRGSTGTRERTVPGQGVTAGWDSWR